MPSCGDCATVSKRQQRQAKAGGRGGIQHVWRLRSHDQRKGKARADLDLSEFTDRRTSRSSGRGERGCAFRSAASAAESAKCRMLQPAAQRAESRQPQPAAQPATSLRTERATRVPECVRCSLFEHTSVRPRRFALALPPAHRTYRPARGSRDVLSPVFKHHRYVGHHGGSGAARRSADSALPGAHAVSAVYFLSG